MSLEFGAPFFWQAAPILSLDAIRFGRGLEGDVFPQLFAAIG
eukprot:CAMPEP_0206633338 /NCGR_PEP_ID=MMETSP0325_2-20121206/69433_1 /ASSEMBLY_ACC=CAM_ASM_000347 /TAXON_ID=2866 /ORGANISM="Crypthecodinium cohnii, Strain Seligo" /LENGTH=41 /DNA_ID= /DNA_START= /DNA_END= /DNA_ORIENTATION=